MRQCRQDITSTRFKRGTPWNAYCLCYLSMCELANEEDARLAGNISKRTYRGSYHSWEQVYRDCYNTLCAINALVSAKFTST